MKRKIPKWFPIIIVVACLLALYFVFVPFSSSPLNNPDVICVNGIIKIKSSGLGFEVDYIIGQTAELDEMRINLLCSIEGNSNSLVDYSITSQISCVNNVPTAICKTRLYKAILMGKIKSISTDKKGTENNTSSQSNRCDPFNSEEPCF